MAIEALTIKVGVDLTAIEAAEARVQALLAKARGIGRGGLPGGPGVPQTAATAAHSALSRAAETVGIADKPATGAAEQQAAIKRTTANERIASAQTELGAAKTSAAKQYPVGYNFANEALITRNVAGDIVRYEKGYNFAMEVATIPGQSSLSGDSLFTRGVSQVRSFIPVGATRAGFKQLLSKSGFGKLAKVGSIATAIMLGMKTGEMYEQDIQMAGDASTREVAVRSFVGAAQDMSAGILEFVGNRWLDSLALSSMLTSSLLGTSRRDAQREADTIGVMRQRWREKTRTSRERVQAESEAAARRQEMENVTNATQNTIDAIRESIAKDEQLALESFEQRSAGMGMIFTDRQREFYRSYLAALAAKRLEHDLARINPKTGQRGPSWSGDFN